MFIAEKEMVMFDEDEFEYIRSLNNYDDTVKGELRSLVKILSSHSSEDKKFQINKENGSRYVNFPKPDYLHSFMKFIVECMDEYKNSGTKEDWDVKEALMHVL